MLIKWMKYISCPILIGIMFFVTGCKTGLDVDRLPLDEDFVQDARVAFFEADRTGVITDYAQVDPGGATSDGFAITENTDADGIMSAATGAKERLFIQLPASEARRDHILRAIAAASIREDLKKGDRWNLLVLNTKKMKSNVATYGFDDTKAKEYFLSIARKLNDQKLSSNDIIVVNIDEFPFGLTADEFFNALSDPHIVALSSQGVDSVKTFANKEESGEFFSKGLNPGHIYKLVKARLLRSKNIKDKGQQDATSLIIAKVITALEPNGNLGSLAKFFTLIDPIVDGAITVSNLSDEILKALASFFQANYHYLKELNLDSKTLTEIHDSVKKNALAFSEQARKTDKILKNVETLLSSGLGTLGEKLTRGFRATRSDIEDLRNGALPEMERNLIDSGDKNRDEVIGMANRNIKSATDKLVKDAKERHAATQNVVRKNVSSIVEEAQSKIDQDSRERLAELTESFFALVKDAVRKLQADNASSAKNINETVARLLKRAIVALSEHATSVGDSTVSSLSDEVAQSIVDLKGFGRSQSRKTIEEISTTTGEKITKAQSQISKTTSDAVSDSEAVVVRSLSDEANELKNLLAAAIKKAIAENKSVAGGIAQNSSEAIKRTQKILIDALAQAKEEIKKRVNDEHQSTRTEVESSTSRDLAKTASKLTAHTTAQHDGTKQAVAKNVATIVEDSRVALEQALDRQSQETKDLVSDIVANAIKKIILDNKAVANDIAGRTTSAMARAQRSLADALTHAEEEIKQRIAEQGQVIRIDVKGDIVKEAAKASRDVKDDITDLKKQLAQSQRRIISLTSGTFSDAQATLERQSQEVKDVMNELLAAAVKKILAGNKDSVGSLGDRINTHTTRVIKKAEELLAEALTQAEQEIKNRMDNIQTGVDDVKTAVSKHVTKSATNVIADLRRSLVETQKHLTANATRTADDVQDAIEKGQQQATQELNEALMGAVKKILAGNKEGNESIKANISGVIKRAERIARDTRIETEDTLTKRLSDEGSLTREDIKSNMRAAISRIPSEVDKTVHPRVIAEGKNIAKTIGALVTNAQADLEENLAEKIASAQEQLERAMKRVSKESRDETRKAGQELRAQNVAIASSLKRTLEAVEASMIQKILEEAGITRDEVSQASVSTKNRIRSLMRTLRLFIGENIPNFYRKYRERLELVVRNVKGLGAGKSTDDYSIIPGGDHHRRHARLDIAASKASQEFARQIRSGEINAQAVRTAAADGYQAQLLVGVVPAALARTHPAEVNVVNAIRGDADLLQIVKDEAILAASEQASNPDIHVGDPIKTSNPDQDPAFDNQNLGDFRQPLDQMQDKIENREEGK